MNTEQDTAILELRGLEDQIEKKHWLNVHFRAFQLANYGWQQHILANARAGSRKHRSPGAAVLDNDRDGPEAAHEQAPQDTVQDTEGLDVFGQKIDRGFGEALGDLLNGLLFSRRSWNDSTVFVFLREAKPIGGGPLRAPFDASAVLKAHLCKRGRDGECVVGWLPDTEELFATDWYTV